MKKIIFTLLIAALSSITIVACTEEDIAPTMADMNGGGVGIDPK